MMKNVNNENKTLLEQLQAMGTDKLKQLKDMIKYRIIQAELVNIRMALEAKNKLYAFPAPNLKYNFDEASHYNKMINFVNEFINPLSYLLGFNTDNNDYFYDNKSPDFYSSAKGFTIGRLKKYSSESALQALEQ